MTMIFMTTGASGMHLLPLLLRDGTSRDTTTDTTMTGRTIEVTATDAAGLTMTTIESKDTVVACDIPTIMTGLGTSATERVAGHRIET